MSIAGARLLSGDARTIEFERWQQWLSHAAKVARVFDNAEDDPFAYNEAASVSILTAAAALSGMQGIAEYTSRKLSSKDRRVRTNGRADFWLSCERRSWSFEFKQFMIYGSIPRVRLKTVLGVAIRNAQCIAKQESDSRIAAMIVPTYQAIMADHTKLDQLHVALASFAEQVDWAWIIDPGGRHAAPTYIYFKKC